MRLWSGSAREGCGDVRLLEILPEFDGAVDGVEVGVEPADPLLVLLQVLHELGLPVLIPVVGSLALLELPDLLLGGFRLLQQTHGNPGNSGNYSEISDRSC